MRTCEEVSIATALTACLSPVTRCGGLGSDKPSRAAAVFSVCRRAACWYGRLRCCWPLHAPTVHSTRCVWQCRCMLRQCMPSMPSPSDRQAGVRTGGRGCPSLACPTQAPSAPWPASCLPHDTRACTHALARKARVCATHLHMHTCVCTHMQAHRRARSCSQAHAAPMRFDSGRAWTLQEELDDGSQQLQLDLHRKVAVRSLELIVLTD